MSGPDYDLVRKMRRENPEQERSRLLTLAGPGAEHYRIVRSEDDMLATEFRTVGVNGKTADETATANLADWSEQHGGEFLLFRIEIGDPKLMGWAQAGVVTSYSPVAA